MNVIYHLVTFVLRYVAITAWPNQIQPNNLTSHWNGNEIVFVRHWLRLKFVHQMRVLLVHLLLIFMRRFQFNLFHVKLMHNANKHTYTDRKAVLVNKSYESWSIPCPWLRFVVPYITLNNEYRRLNCAVHSIFGPKDNNVGRCACALPLDWALFKTKGIDKHMNSTKRLKMMGKIYRNGV